MPPLAVAPGTSAAPKARSSSWPGTGSTGTGETLEPHGPLGGFAADDRRELCGGVERGPIDGRDDPDLALGEERRDAGDGFSGWSPARSGTPVQSTREARGARVGDLASWPAPT